MNKQVNSRTEKGKGYYQDPGILTLCVPIILEIKGSKLLVLCSPKNVNKLPGAFRYNVQTVDSTVSNFVNNGWASVNILTPDGVIHSPGEHSHRLLTELLTGAGIPCE